eukprot:CAMPEP_0198316150 /NCGR_PEP_ID=MMETSP1450-20131203/6150_1 /TAXON_ID=753684 ORGANISM="Madagascaria erythrocladiodes, Strain CCMP3234" /NCGR_SAMPLE_ID=MMETSP1450 /ASSEMBLY_ACC=CAM_ASM_001115 /LENGTH=118 /DNA_ID=CAMNT_0044019293 /DNA_START=45 /DNA_END=398 /DNA_ORIENTATION=+
MAAYVVELVKMNQSRQHCEAALLRAVRVLERDNNDAVGADALTLSEAFALLWLDAESGDVWGRRTNYDLNHGLLVAAVCDLVALGRVHVYESQRVGWFGATARIALIDTARVLRAPHV